MGFLLAYLHLTVAHSKDEGHSYAHFDNEYILEMVTARIQINIAIN